MRVLYVIDSLGASGAEHSTAAMMPLLRDRGHQVAVATLYEAGFGDEERIRADGFDVRPLRARRLFGRVRELRARIRSERPDVVHTALFDADIVGRLAGWRTGTRVVSSLVNTTYDAARTSDPNLRRWKLRVVQLIDAVTGRLFVDRFHAVTHGVASANAHDLRVPRARIDVVHRGRSRDRLGEWSQERRDRVRASLGIAADVPLVLAVGRQEHQKAHVALVAATDVLLQRLPTAKVLIAGREGNASPMLQAALGLHPAAAAAIVQLGHRHDVPDLLCAADVLAIPSRYEGTAGAALEAMALRCPVVCTDLAGVVGVLAADDNALLVPVDQPPAMADALERVLSDPMLAARLRDRGLADFEQRFAIDVAAAAMETFYLDVVARGRKVRAPRGGAAPSIVGLLGSRLVAGAFGALSRRRLRSVAYHTVDDPRAFATQLDHFQKCGYTTVTAGQVADALHGVAPLPDRPLWITFDDGDVSVVRSGLPLLKARGMVATAFLCGKWIDTDDAPWWQIVEAAVAAGVVDALDLPQPGVDPADLVQVRLALKGADDADRRRAVDRFAERLAASGAAVVGRQWTAADVSAWLAAGNDVGNHSWDHPCLDRCTEAEQQRQIELAHERLSMLVGRPLDTFAWPNGDPSAPALAALRSLGYRLVAECDHRLVARRADPFAVSRLRLDASVPIARTRAVVSGAHPAVYRLQQRLRGRRPTNDVT